jgi:hypothetical protein
MKVLTGLILLAQATHTAFGLAADLPLNSAPLPIAEGTFGTPEGCLMRHGNAAEGPALWLTQWEIQTAELHCDIDSWAQDSNGSLEIDCGPRKFLILPRTKTEQWMVVVELTGAQSFRTYPLARCGSK